MEGNNQLEAGDFDVIIGGSSDCDNMIPISVF